MTVFIFSLLRMIRQFSRFIRIGSFRICRL
jgi:hypothetical protein